MVPDLKPGLFNAGQKRPFLELSKPSPLNTTSQLNMYYRESGNEVDKGAMASDAEPNGEIDESLYSRQIYVLGEDAMKTMSLSRRRLS